ncbi:Uncharacterized protein K02A2.6 [Eumeta japonica]|uniref:Uncharacterized protein K02A2.6 n=1 Tax=Eumeta variegata TaxID=151549 RepID=A0A4C1T770_EUMVA|nr:Uncharacterized protein K02A2.6 [Eumeta japonica]
MTANRLQRYALFLSAYNYTVQYVRSANNVAGSISLSSAAAPTERRGHARRAPMLRTGKLTRIYILFRVLVARDRCGHRERSARGACTALCPPARAPLAPWPYPARPWERVHLDMLSVAGGTHLVVVDAHSKWVEGLPRGRCGHRAVRLVSPAQLMLGRNVRTRLDLLCPRKDVPKHVAPAPSAANLAQSVSRSQISQSKYFGGNEN